MREIKFRGYNEKIGIWCYGYYLEQSGYSYIVDFDSVVETTKNCSDVFKDLGWSLVDEKSVGQYTGLKDKNGKEIYEGDIVEYKYLNTLEQETRKSEVQLMPIGDVNRNIQAYYPFCYSIAGSYKEDNREITECYLTPSDACEIIGNIYENPELLN